MGIHITVRSVNLILKFRKKRVASFIINKKLRRIIFEMGKILNGKCGIIISKVIYAKKTREKYFIIIDTGMKDDMARSVSVKPFFMKFYQLKKFKNLIKIEFVVTICESGIGTFGIYKNYSILKEGDLLLDCGAYGRTFKF